jgi:non-homologous end joining protein Ku
MTKIINLDQLATKRDKVVVLGGVEHVMATLTVKDYVQQMKSSTKINEILKQEEADLESTEMVMNLTIEALMKLFPSITKDQFESLNMEQLTAIRELSEDYAAEDAPEPQPGE